MMKVDTLTLLAACLLVALTVKCQPIGLPVFTVNLRTGAVSLLPAGISWHSSLTAGSGGACACDRQGVLKLTFIPSVRVRAEINMTFGQSVAYTFDVGDSVTNDAFGGDIDTQQNHAEVHSFGNCIYFYGKEYPVGGSYDLLYHAANYVAINPHTTVTLNIADELAIAHNGINYIYINSHKLFALNGQKDKGGVNYNVYLGMNRVVRTPLKYGKGLCYVSIRFYNF